MSKRAYSIILLFSILIIIGGCFAYKTKDGATRYKLRPETSKKFEEGTQGGIDLLTALAPFLGPVGGIAAGGLAAGLAVFKRVKPKLEETQNKYELSNAVAGIAVEAIEQIKKDNPKLWTSMAEKLQKDCAESGIDTKVVKNFIRGLRGLPAKV